MTTEGIHMVQRIVRAAAILPVGLIAVCANAAETPTMGGWHPYVGVSAGTASISTTARMVDGTSIGLDRHPPTLGLFAGVRPARHFGIELNYLNFAAVNAPAPPPPTTGNNVYYKAESKAWSLGAFAVGYLPLGKTPLELYGKLGGALVENRQKTLGDYSQTQLCIYDPATEVCKPVGVAATDTTKSHVDPAVGAGLQYRLGDFRLRLDLQRSFSPNLNPTAATLGVGYSW
jgi:hypothetical protein